MAEPFPPPPVEQQTLKSHLEAVRLLGRGAVALRQALESHLGKHLKTVTEADKFCVKVLGEMERWKA